MKLRDVNPRVFYLLLVMAGLLLLLAMCHRGP